MDTTLGLVAPRALNLSIAIPHAPHKPGREASLARLLKTLGDNPDPGDHQARVFSDKEPHWEWSKRLWSWGYETGADYLIQLQDDVTVPDNFWAAVRALLAAQPHEVTALFGIHPLGREIARQGGRCYRTRAWLMGNGYILSRAFLKDLLPWVFANEPIARVTCEDSLINRFVNDTGRDVYHPTPSLVEHDLSIESTWSQQANSMGVDRPENHGHRSATVSWRDYSPQELERPSFWTQQGEIRLLPDNLGPRCWFCLQEGAYISSRETGVHVGPNCFSRMAAEAAQRMMNR